MTEVNKKKIPRRSFLKGSSLGLLGGLAGFSLVSKFTLRSKTDLLRPPGALEEASFLASCIKCGQCLQVCPPQVIKLANITQGFGVGTPYIIPSEGACILCEGLPCVLACPTGSLDHHISEGKEAKMGLAVLSKPESCLSLKNESGIQFLLDKFKKDSSSWAEHRTESLFEAWLPQLSSNDKNLWTEKFQIKEITKKSMKPFFTKSNLSWFQEQYQKSNTAKSPCKICLDTCPIKKESPIVFKSNLDQGPTPTVQESCVGCGVCEFKCPTDEPCMTIVPRKKWENPA